MKENFPPSDSSRSNSASLSMTSAGTVTPACWILVHTESGSRGGGPGLEATASAMSVRFYFTSQAHVNHFISHFCHASTLNVEACICNFYDILILHHPNLTGCGELDLLLRWFCYCAAGLKAAFGQPARFPHRQSLQLLHWKPFIVHRNWYMIKMQSINGFF